MEYRIAVASQVSQLLKNLRKERGLTQKELGQRIGIGQRMVAQIEKAPEKMRFERLVQILSEFKVDLVIRERETDSVKNNLEPW